MMNSMEGIVYPAPKMSPGYRMYRMSPVPRHSRRTVV